jgi:hypothetical protein
MNPKEPTKDPTRETKTDTGSEHQEQRKAPPIEREHETQSGILEEDERRDRERR